MTKDYDQLVQTFQETSEQLQRLQKKEQEFIETQAHALAMRSEVDQLTAERDKLSQKNEKVEAIVNVQTEELGGAKEAIIKHKRQIAD